MPTGSSITNSIRKPYNSNKRLLGLLTVFGILIGSLVVGYIYHIKGNEKNFREAKLQRLDAFFSVIARQLDNKLESYKATHGRESERLSTYGNQEATITDTTSAERKIWQDAKKIAADFSLGEKEFDHYILVIKNQRTLSGADNTIYQSCLKGSKMPPDTLFKSDVLNIGISMPVPNENPKYQLFGKTYRYESAVNTPGNKRSKSSRKTSGTTSGNMDDTAEQAIAYDIQIIGLMEADRYRENIQKLDPWVIALLTTFLLLALFGLPFFKMLFIAEDERLSSTDVITSGISVVIGAPILILVFLSLMDHYYQSHDIIPERLKKLGEDIGQRFERENNELVKQLYTISLDNVEETYLQWNCALNEKEDKKDAGCGIDLNSQKSRKKPGQNKIQMPSVLRDTLFTKVEDQSDIMEHFKFISKIDSSGKTRYHIALINNEDIRDTWDLSSRPYFQAFAKEETQWTRSIIHTLRSDTGLPDNRQSDTLADNTLQNDIRKGDTIPNGTPEEGAFEEEGGLQIDTVKIKYAMRTVVSVEDQTEEAVYILQNEYDAVPGYRVGSSRMKSVHDAILPFGYQFAIIDQQGEVWFHSEAGRSTLENLFDASRNPDRLRAAVTGRVHVGGSVEYRDKNKLFNVTPIAGTPLSVVSMYDIGLIRTRTSEVLTLAGLAIILAFLLMLGLAALSLIIRDPKLGLFKYDRFLFEFLTPQKDKRATYVLLSLFFIGVLAIVLFLVTLSDVPMKVYILCILTAMWAYLMVYYALHQYRNQRHFKFRVRDALLLSVIILLNMLLIKIGPSELVFSELVFTVSTFTLQLLFMVVVGFNILTEGPKQRFFWYFKVMKSLGSYDPFKLRIDHKYWHAIFLFTWLVLAAIYPACLMFGRSLQLNDEVWFRADQLYMSKKAMVKERKLMADLKAYPDTTDSQNLARQFELLYDKHVQGGVYPDSIELEKENDNRVTLKSEDTLFQDLLWNTRPLYDRRLLQFQSLAFSRAADSSWSSREVSADSLFHFRRLGRTEGWTVSGYDGPNLMGKEVGSPWYDVLGIAILLALLFSLILFFSDRFFAFRFRYIKPDRFKVNQEREYFKNMGKLLSEDAQNYGILLIGPPFSGRDKFAWRVIHATGILDSDRKEADYYARKQQDAKFREKGREDMGHPAQERQDVWKPDADKPERKHPKVGVLSMLRLDSDNVNSEPSELLALLALDADDGNDSPSSWRHKDIFIIEHLEHNIKSFDANHAKLRLLSFLISEKKRIILISEVYPSQIFALYENPPHDADKPLSRFEDDFNSWRNILSAFPQVLIGIWENKEEVRKHLNLDYESSSNERRDLLAHLVDELGHSLFLPSLAPIIMSKTLYETTERDESTERLVRVQRIDHQRMVMQIQNIGHGYYNDIWNGLPTRERYLLYDLAKDGFLNIKNRNSLFALMKKGLIVWRDRPRIFNESFKNFIHTSVSLNEALRLERKNQASGSWSNVRIVFYLIIATTIAFIIMGKPELLQDFEALIGALGGLGVIIPLVSKLLASGAGK